MSDIPDPDTVTLTYEALQDLHASVELYARLTVEYSDQLHAIRTAFITADTPTDLINEIKRILDIR